MIEDVAVVLAFANLAPTHSLRFHRMAAFDPQPNVDVVHVLLDDMVAGNPCKHIPVMHLVFHEGPLRLLWNGRD